MFSIHLSRCTNFTTFLNCRGNLREEKFHAVTYFDSFSFWNIIRYSLCFRIVCDLAGAHQFSWHGKTKKAGMVGWIEVGLFFSCVFKKVLTNQRQSWSRIFHSVWWGWGEGRGLLVFGYNFVGSLYLIFLDPSLHSGDIWVEFVVGFHLTLRVFFLGTKLNGFPFSRKKKKNSFF